MLNIRFWFFVLLLVAPAALSVHAETDGSTPALNGNFSNPHLSASSSNPDSSKVELAASTPFYQANPSALSPDGRFERCLRCHEGISPTSPSHPLEWGCTVCHGGDGGAVDKETAHSTLIYDPGSESGRRNPSSLSVVDRSCGQLQCHAGHDQEDRNHIQRVKKSLMAHLAGVISGLRYQWAGQGDTTARYGVFAVQDNDGEIPESRGAVKTLEPLPFFSLQNRHRASVRTGQKENQKVSRHIGDSLLRDRCFQCHLDAPAGPGQFRSQGCAACHFTYAEDGRYQGKDPTIPKTEAGHPAFHKLTPLPSNNHCLQCHREFGSTPPFKNALIEEPEVPAASPAFPGSGSPRPDVHFRLGFDCVDCHTQFDIMGDGNIYSKQYQAVEIRCETCHGDADTRPTIVQVTDPLDRVIRLGRHYNGWSNTAGDWMVVSAHNRKMTNVKVQNNEIMTLGKRSGTAYRTPLIKDNLESHQIPAHRAKLECTACHSRWVPGCKGCHNTLDQSRTGKMDSSKNDGTWSLSDYILEPMEPVLMVGPRGKVVPMLDQPRRTVNVLDEQGNPLPVIGSRGEFLGRYLDWGFTNPHGYSGSKTAYAMNPHSVSREVRSCASCHLNPKALGLGEGDFQIGKSATGRNDQIEPLNRSLEARQQLKLPPEATVTSRGEPIAGTHQPGARPFNQEEIIRILKVGTCIPCHDRYDDPIYQNIRKSYEFEKTLAHRQVRNQVLNQ